MINTTVPRPKTINTTTVPQIHREVRVGGRRRRRARRNQRTTRAQRAHVSAKNLFFLQ